KNTDSEEEDGSLSKNRIVRCNTDLREGKALKRIQTMRFVSGTLSRGPNVLETIIKKDWTKKTYDLRDDIMDAIKNIQWNIRMVKHDKESKKLIRNIKERQNAVIELVENENRFLNNMNLLEKVLEFLKNYDSCCTFELARRLIKPIINITKIFKDEVDKVVVKDGQYGRGICAIFDNYFMKFKCYSPFIDLYKRLMSDFVDKVTERPEGKIAKYAESLKVDKQTDLDSLSSMPFQHIMRYRIQVERIVETLPKYHTLYTEYAKIQPVVNGVIESINKEYSDFAEDVELMGILSGNHFKFEKSIFGRKFVKMETVEVQFNKSDSGKKAEKVMKKKMSAIVLTDALVLVKEKLGETLEDIKAKKNFEIENVLYLENVYLTLTSTNEIELVDRKNKHYIIKNNSNNQPNELFSVLEKNRNDIWKKYTTFIENVVDVYKPYEELVFPGCSFHCTVTTQNSAQHILISGFYLRIFQTIELCVKNKDPNTSLNLFLVHPTLIKTEKNWKIVLRHTNETEQSEAVTLEFENANNSAICYNMIFYSKHEFLLSNSPPIPVVKDLSVLPYSQTLCDFAKTNNGNDKCINCGKKSEFVDSSLGFFCCKLCKQLHLKKNPTKSSEKLIPISSLNPHNTLFTSINLPGLVSKGNDFIKAFYPMSSMF
ncbi:hypothetical protein EIN_403900, partial [Entamoeba invadens IP1]